MEFKKIVFYGAFFAFVFLTIKAKKVSDREFFNDPMYFVTVADTEHYSWLIVLLDSIVTYHKHQKGFIMVFDIGLTGDERSFIESHYNARVYPIELSHPDLIKKFVVRPNGRLARGWYAWKPVAMKQAFDYVPYFLYIDAGKRLVGPVDDIFHMISKQGYFLFDCGHTIDPMTTERVKEKFGLHTSANKRILHQFGVEAGIQGLSKAVYHKYILPLYELAHDIRWFEDDGTASWGFGGSRHDQVLFSIQARMQNYKIHKVCGDGPEFLDKKKKKRFNRNNYFQYKKFEDNPRAQENHLMDG